MMRILVAVAALAVMAGSVHAQSLGDALSAVPGADEAVSDATSSALSAAASDALTVENFDPDTVKELIAQAPLEDTQKETLNSAVDAAADNPELVQGAIDQVKGALGL